MDRRKFFQVLEIVFVFVGLPLLYKFDFIPIHKSIPLLAVFFIYLIILVRKKDFNKKNFWLNKFGNWRIIILRVIGFFAMSVLVVLVFFPEKFFITPRKMPLVWLVILFSYPLWSAYPQELIYRAYFYERFKGLFTNENILVYLNAILFAFSHIIFTNWIAIALTFVGSFVLSWTYKNSRSLLVVFLEHAMYGNIIFTVGLGDFFYLPLD